MLKTMWKMFTETLLGGMLFFGILFAIAAIFWFIFDFLLK
jgi:hypothetical protein